MKKTYYLIDTENIGDKWIHLIDDISKDDMLIVFYSENHSRLLEETYLKQRYNTQIKWVECVTGPDALDYQLAGVLSYLITLDPGASYIICSNDKDYRNETGFWSERCIDVSRKGFPRASTPCSKPGSSNAASDALRDYISKLPDSFLCADNLAVLTSEHVDEILTELSRAIPVSALYCWNVTLTALFGQTQSAPLYAKVKADEVVRETLHKNLFADGNDRQIYLIAIMMKANGLNPEKAFTAQRIICRHGTKDISALKADFMKQFGKKPQQLRYFSCLRPILTSINSLLISPSVPAPKSAGTQTNTQTSSPAPVKVPQEPAKNKRKGLNLFSLCRRKKEKIDNKQLPVRELKKEMK